MVRQCIGKTCWGGAIALVTILLFSLDIGGQEFRAREVTCTISGSVGIGSVTMRGFPGDPVVSDDNGNYSTTVKYGWAGMVTPAKVGYTFEPASRTYQKVTENQANQDYRANEITFTISGTTGIAGVEMKGLPGNPVTGAGGMYTVKVNYGFSGTVVPTKEGRTFKPESKTYTPVTSDQLDQNYTGTLVTFVISGTTRVDGVVMKGLPGDPVTSSDGSYKAVAEYGWNGVVTPTKAGYTFDPLSREYTNLSGPMPNQDYTGTLLTYAISGSTGVPGVVMNGVPGSPVSGEDGSYSAVVDYGWSGTITPAKEGFTFTPPRKAYSSIASDQVNQNYQAAAITFALSGKIGVGGALLSGLPGNPVSDPNGNYKVTVDYGWSGTVVPEKAGFTFDPASRNYPKITADQSNQNYTAAKMRFTISGSTGVAGVALKGLQGNPISGKDGSYTAGVDYGWTGNVVPAKDGYTFDPPSRAYRDVIGAQPDQDYSAEIIKRTITGKIDSEKGPVADVSVVTDVGVIATTGADGIYTLSVNYGWRGKVTPVKEGYTFKPLMRAYETVTQDQTAQSYTSEVRMLTISGRVTVGGTPIGGVKITGNNGGGSTVTDEQGGYSVKVPYGWTGDLTPEKEGLIFEPPSFSYTDVKQDIKEGVPEPTKPPEQKTIEPTVPEKVEPQGPPTVPETEEHRPVLTDREQQLLQQNEKLRRELEEAQRTKSQEIPSELPTVQRGQVIPPPLGGGKQMLGPSVPGVVQGGYVTAVFAGIDLKDALREIATQTGINIYVDDTVKAAPVMCQLSQVPIETALQTVLKGTKYAFRKIPKSYLVYMPVTNTWVESELRTVLQDISSAVGVVIIADEAVSGLVSAELKDVPLDTALEIILSGTGFVVKKTPYYYLVSSSAPDAASFPNVSETRTVKLNYMPADKAITLLAAAFKRYVQAVTDTYTVSITAPPVLADRIVADLRDIDRKPRHVMLDARVVVMERGDLLNLGVEWGWPKISAGIFGGTPEIEATTGRTLAKWPWGVQIGYSSDKTFTDALLLTLNMLSENSELDIIATPQVLAQDGKVAEMRVVTEEYYYMTPPGATSIYTYGELKTVESGTILNITPRIGDNNDITLEMSVEVSDSIPAGRGSDLPVVTRRTAKNTVRIKDGGTVALAGLSENRGRSTKKSVPGLSELPLVGGLFVYDNTDKATRQVAVFVTANIVPDDEKLLEQLAAEPAWQEVQAKPVGEEFKLSLKESLSRQPK